MMVAKYISADDGIPPLIPSNENSPNPNCHIYEVPTEITNIDDMVFREFDMKLSKTISFSIIIIFLKIRLTPFFLF